VNHYLPPPFPLGGKPLVSKIPAHLRYAGFFNLLLGGALLASVTTLAYTFTRLGQFTQSASPRVVVADKQEQNGSQVVPARFANFCPFPFNPANPACQAVAVTTMPVAQPAPPANQMMADVPADETLTLMPVTPLPAAEVGGSQPALGWIYAGKNEISKVIQADAVLAGQSYTMLQSINVRRFPISSKSSENRKILTTVSAGEKIQVLALERNGEHLWLQIARPLSQNALNQTGQAEGT
jgi:hypothetical protein